MQPLFAIVTGPEIIIVGAIILVLFGAERLPKLARSMGQAKREFEAAAHQSAPPPPSVTPPPPEPPPPPPANPPYGGPPTP